MIEEFTICLHCGCNRDIVNAQMEALKPLENKYRVHWNNRIDRREWYDSYSELINHSMVTSPTEYVILINDRTHPKPHEVESILQYLDTGYAAATKYSVGFMGFAKELLRRIGPWDQRFYGGGYEDDDFVLRLRLANLAYYESCEAQYDYHWKTPLQPQDGLKCSKSSVHFHQKWEIGPASIGRRLTEEKYDYDFGPDRFDISGRWLPWEYSFIGIEFETRPNQGPSRTHHFKYKNGPEFKRVFSYV